MCRWRRPGDSIFHSTTRCWAVRRGVIVVPGRGVFARVTHPGTTGKHPVSDAFREAAKPAGRAGAAVFTDAVRAHMG